jgi:hypothetical protein
MNTTFGSKLFSSIRNLTLGKNEIQFGIIAVTVLVSLVASYWGSMTIFIVLIAAVVGIPFFLLLIKYPNLGYIFVLLGGWFVPVKGPGGFNASILMVILMIVLWLMDMFVVKRRFEFLHSRVLRPAVYFMIVSVIAFAMGQISWFSFANQAPLDAQIGGFAIYFFLVATMIMTANTLRDVRWLKAFIWTFVGLGTIYVLFRVASISVIDKIFAHGVYANSMFWTWLVAMPLSQAIFNDELKLKYRIVLFGIIAATFYVALVQQNDWKSGWVPPAVVAGTLMALRFKKLALMAIPFAVIVAGYLAIDLIATDTYSWGTRVDAWLVVLDISKISPIIGLGFANYYWYAQVFTIRGYHIRFNSHSQFVDIIAQTGVVGLFLFFWILYEVGRLSWDLTQKLPTGFERGYAYGVFSGIMGSLMAAFLVDWVLPFAYNIGLDGVRASILPWIFFGALIAIEQIHKEKNHS